MRKMDLSLRDGRCLDQKGTPGAKHWGILSVDAMITALNQRAMFRALDVPPTDGQVHEPRSWGTQRLRHITVSIRIHTKT